MLARKRSSDTTPAQWRAMVEKRLQPINLKLHNYGGDQLPVVRQTTVSLSQGCHSISATVQVQKGAPTPLLVGTVMLSALGFALQQKDADGTCIDLLQVQPQAQENVGAEGQLAEEDNLQIAEALVEPDSDGVLTVLLENQSCEPIFLKKGVVLGTIFLKKGVVLGTLQEVQLACGTCPFALLWLPPKCKFHRYFSSLISNGP